MRRAAIAVLACLLPGGVTRAQDNPPPEARAEAREKRDIPLKVQVLVTRSQGEKKVGSLPYSLQCTAGSLGSGNRASARVRVGIDIPIVTRVEGATQTVFKSVGGAVDCEASEVGPGLFKLNLTVEQSSLHAPGSPGTDGTPTLRTFRSQFNTYLRDGQSADHVSAGDPLTGEVVKVGVTLSVLK